MSLKKGQKVEVTDRGIVYSGKIINFGPLNESGIPKEYLIEFIVPGTAGQNVFKEYVPVEHIQVVTGAPSWNATANPWPSGTAAAAATNVRPSAAASSAAANMPSYMGETTEHFIAGDRVEVKDNGVWERGTVMSIKNGIYSVTLDRGDNKHNIYRENIRIPVARPELARGPIKKISWKMLIEAHTTASEAVSAVADTSWWDRITKPISNEVEDTLQYRSCADFDFVMRYLEKCEALRQFMWQKLQGDLSGTCGYTGPALGILLLIFKTNKIRGKKTLNSFLQSNPITYGENLKQAHTRFMAVVNETAGNFLDLCDITPVTQTRNGIMGLIEEEETNPGQGKVVLVDSINLVKGPNVISFKHRGIGNCTFHHSMIYAIPEQDTCFILDSWMNNATMICRLPTCRRYTFNEVQFALLALNSPQCTVAGARHTFSYFDPPDTFLPGIQQGNIFQVYVLSQEEIRRVYSECEFKMIGVYKTEFGGYNHKKKNVKTKKFYKKPNIKTKKPHARRYIRNKKHRTRRQIRAK